MLEAGGSASTVVLIGSGLYVLGLLFIGIYASRQVGDSTDFVVAGRRLPLWLCTFTLFATWFGAGTCIGAAGAAYASGVQGVIADPFGAALCLLLAGMFYVRFLRRMRLLTVPDFFRRRFGQTAEIAAGLCVLPAYVGWVASQFSAFGIILHTLTGIDTVVATVIGAAVVLVYTTAGGMWAVTLTDFVQGLVLILGLLLLVPYVLSDMGGFTGLVGSAPEGTFALLPSGDFRAWLWYLQAWLVIGIGSIPGQDLFQRALAAKDERVAQWSAYAAGALYLSVGLLPVLLGIAGALVIPEIGDPEHIIPALGIKYLHPVLLAIFVGALFSALMSSADSALLAPASIFGLNILRSLRPELSEQGLLRAIRWSVLGTGLLSLATALHFQNVYNLMVNSWSVLMVSLFVPLTAGIYWRRANAPAAVASILLGVSTWIGLLWYQDAYPSDLAATFVALVVFFVVARLTARSHPPLPVTDADGAPVAYERRLGVLPLR